MDEQEKINDTPEEPSINIDVTGERGEKVKIGPGEIHIKDGKDEVRVSWTGIRVRDDDVDINISVWKPLLAFAIGLIVLVALLTITVVSIVKLMM